MKIRTDRQALRLILALLQDTTNADTWGEVTTAVVEAILVARQQIDLPR